MVGTPVGLLKVRLEEVAFGEVGSAVGGDSAEFVHRAVHGVRGFAALSNVGLVIRDSGYAGPWPSATMARAKARIPRDS